MRVRPAKQDDLPSILAIYNEAVLNTTATYDYEPWTLDQRRVWFAEQQTENLPVFVAEEEAGGVVGWSCLRPFRPRIGYRFTVENSIYVAADRRGQGIGKLLMPPLITAARERGFHAIIAAIDADSEVSLRLHAAFGFVEVGHLKEVGFKFGRWLDVLYLELLL